MSFGKFYIIDDEVRSFFEGRTTKSDWYDALGEIEIQNSESCDAEESIPAWILALKNEEQPLNLLFQGELRAEPNEYDDPDVVFIGKDMIFSIVKELEKKPKPYFQKLLDNVNCSADFWLFDSMFQFLKSAGANKKAIVIIWGG
ncbi:hypothetical protein [Nitrincola sp. MINF-07-Sa-05]|uniref:hypothetical protein n=1 Tax=Nitrincola salilacus TaxID=3400273 RepID=UPI0039185EEA